SRTDRGAALENDLLAEALDRGADRRAAALHYLQSAVAGEMGAARTAGYELRAARVNFGGKIGAARADDFAASRNDRAAGDAAGFDQLHAGRNRRAVGLAEHDLRAAGDFRAHVRAAGADDLGAPGEDRRRIGEPAGQHGELAAAGYDRVDVGAAGGNDE